MSIQDTSFFPVSGPANGALPVRLL